MQYYGNLNYATKPGPMAGRRYVHEFNPSKDCTRGWHETLDHQGSIRQIRPEFNNGFKRHYLFDKQGNYCGSW